MQQEVGEVIVHARDIAELKSIVEPQLSPEDWHGGQADWEQWETVLKLITERCIATAATQLNRTSAKEAADPRNADIKPTRPLLVGASGAFDLEAWRPAALSATLGKLPLRVNGSDNDGMPVTIPGDAFLSYLEQRGSQLRHLHDCSV